MGRCIGRTDLPLDRRKAKRLAHRIRQAARRHHWPRIIHTSPLQRCAAVGRQLRRWGWRHHVDAALLEMDFGAWDGRHWADIAHADIDAWCADFAQHAPGGGESLQAMAARVSAWCAAPGLAPRLIVAHAGWMLLCRWMAQHRGLPDQAAQWPAPPAYCACWPLAFALASPVESAFNSGQSRQPAAGRFWPSSAPGPVANG
jgi:alpha-ribazole phosphatase